jgi:hypothetical protein
MRRCKSPRPRLIRNPFPPDLPRGFPFARTRSSYTVRRPFSCPPRVRGTRDGGAGPSDDISNPPGSPGRPCVALCRLGRRAHPGVAAGAEARASRQAVITDNNASLPGSPTGDSDYVRLPAAGRAPRSPGARGCLGPAVGTQSPRDGVRRTPPGSMAPMRGSRGCRVGTSRRPFGLRPGSRWPPRRG